MSNNVTLRGQAADSPENDRVAPGRFRVRPDDRLAAGTPAPGEVVSGAGPVTHHLDYQAIAPSAGTVLHQMADRPGPMAEAVTVHNARAQVEQMDQARASNTGLAPQLGPRMPSPVPGQPPEHTVVPDNGAPFQGTVARDHGIYSREPHST